MSEPTAEPTAEPTDQLDHVDQHAPAEPERSQLPDLDAIERDLADVELALARLDSGDYWRDEVSGEEIPDDVLAAHPAARRAHA